MQVVWEAVVHWAGQERPEAGALQEAVACALAAMARSCLTPPSAAAPHLFRQPGLLTLRPATVQLMIAAFAQGVQHFPELFLA
jgi:hypothetical protein